MLGFSRVLEGNAGHPTGQVHQKCVQERRHCRHAKEGRQGNDSLDVIAVLGDPAGYRAAAGKANDGRLFAEAGGDIDAAWRPDPDERPK